MSSRSSKNNKNTNKNTAPARAAPAQQNMSAPQNVQNARAPLNSSRQRTKNNSKRNTVQGLDFSSAISDIFNSLTTAFNQPLVLISIITVFALVSTHVDNFDQGAVGKVVCKNSDNAISSWICKNSKHFLGLTIFIPTILDAPRRIQIMVSFLVLGWVFLIPESSMYQYFLQSVALHTYFKVQQRNTRFFIVLVVFLAYLTGYMSVFFPTSPSKPAAEQVIETSA